LLSVGAGQEDRDPGVTPRACGAAPSASTAPPAAHRPCAARGAEPAAPIWHPTGTNTTVGAQVATWAAANAAALHVKYVIFAGQIIDFREPTPAWHACRDPASSCASGRFDHVHISFL
jgi:hypothetical protein